ncbi:MAG: type I-E CRISPR-associated protein Cas6/Cse3/CasE [Candidatus Eisenbacteria bacterium]|uniref:Type I-E CRISPR-associated protein Cas6/Cse3/CasE n=1 Tax=Eiseniibacteriota bacterium TaxID=2212470 RepID=A0A538U3N3_UNCEI|nr:MAG: type I-E CRISPR-associated protein Cas6/Cse3/CasE [Candidatus Eisenbacteria bacterium]
MISMTGTSATASCVNCGRNMRPLHLFSEEAGERGLVEHARAFGDPSLLAAITDLDSVASKGMPRFEAGRRLGFLLRACPVVRLAQATNGHVAGAEIDAFLARCFAVGKDVAVAREKVYRDWIAAKVNQPDATGVTLDRVRVAAILRERLVRRTQGRGRKASRLERPDVRFEGDLVVVDGERLHEWLAHGVGRHRAFGFGALILVPPGTTHAV